MTTERLPKCAADCPGVRYRHVLPDAVGAQFPGYPPRLAGRTYYLGSDCGAAWIQPRDRVVGYGALIIRWSRTGRLYPYDRARHGPEEATP